VVDAHPIAELAAVGRELASMPPSPAKSKWRSRSMRTWSSRNRFGFSVTAIFTSAMQSRPTRTP
jgi:hypothetical protein